jgi:hypothetical protein
MIQAGEPVASLYDEDGWVLDTTTCYEVEEGDKEFPFRVLFTFVVIPKGVAMAGIQVHFPVDGARNRCLKFGAPSQSIGGAVTVSLPMKNV